MEKFVNVSDVVEIQMYLVPGALYLAVDYGYNESSATSAANCNPFSTSSILQAFMGNGPPLCHDHDVVCWETMY